MTLNFIFVQTNFNANPKHPTKQLHDGGEDVCEQRIVL